MSKDEIKVTDIVEIKDNTEARVAFDLMIHISAYEDSKLRANGAAREYWLKLYQDCRNVINRGYIRENIGK